MIKRVSKTGNIVEVEGIVDGANKTVRRNVENYPDLTKKEKQKLWHDMLGIPFTEFEQSVTMKSRIQRLKSFFRRK